MRWLILGGAAALLSVTGGCQTLSEDECLAANWRAIGYEDGTRGYPESRIGRHREACAQYGVMPSLDRYLDGRDEGLLVYCRPDNGFRVGARGGTYEGVCPPRLEDAFLLAYEDGRYLHALEQRVVGIERQISTADSSIDRIDDKIRDIEDRLDNETLTREERRRLRDRIRDLSRDRGAAENEIRRLERSLRRAEFDLRDYRNSLFY